MMSLLKAYAQSIDANFSPEKFHIDFEAGMLKAIERVFPDSEVKGCLFHFTQAVWRKVQAVGLSQAYRAGSIVKR